MPKKIQEYKSDKILALQGEALNLNGAEDPNAQLRTSLGEVTIKGKLGKKNEKVDKKIVENIEAAKLQLKTLQGLYKKFKGLGDNNVQSIAVGIFYSNLDPNDKENAGFFRTFRAWKKELGDLYGDGKTAFEIYTKITTTNDEGLDTQLHAMHDIVKKCYAELQENLAEENQPIRLKDIAAIQQAWHALNQHIQALRLNLRKQCKKLCPDSNAAVSGVSDVYDIFVKKKQSIKHQSKKSFTTALDVLDEERKELDVVLEQSPATKRRIYQTLDAITKYAARKNQRKWKRTSRSRKKEVEDLQKACHDAAEEIEKSYDEKHQLGLIDTLKEKEKRISKGDLQNTVRARAC